MKAIQIEEFGGPEKMRLVEVADPEPGDGDVLVEVARAGVNFADTHAIRNDYQAAQAVLEKTAGELGAREVVGDTKIAKVSIVGVGMRSHAGVASRMFESLAKESINIQMISTSEIKVSVVIEEKYLELAVRALHTAFELDAPARQGE